MVLTADRFMSGLEKAFHANEDFMIDESLIFEVILVSLNTSVCINTDTIHININIFQLGFWLICQVDVF